LSEKLSDDFGKFQNKFLTMLRHFGINFREEVLANGCEFNLKIVRKNFKITGEIFQNIFNRNGEHKPLKQGWAKLAH
jgi:hypothetical protein